MVRPGFRLLGLALAIGHVTAIPALVTLPAFGDPSDPSATVTAIQLGVDSQSGYTTYGVEEHIEQLGPSTTVTLPYTATVVAGSDHVAFASESVSGVGYFLAQECDLNSRNAICSGPQLTTTVPLSSLVPWVIDVVSTGVPSTPTPSQSSSRQVAGSIYGVLGGVLLMTCSLL
ncbi:hypothetical protein C8R45DRAFT_1027547 [Mycena sanguinolenta]|nr:hypothetical protein C8R45DRAFT_1027547 [Mycena sanguinolenta]